MIIPWDKLDHLPVETESGRSLGFVVGVDIDADTHAVKTYRVKSRGIIKGLLNDELLVASAQVISIDSEHMVLGDNAVTDKAFSAKKIVKVAQSAPEVSSTLQSNQN